MKRIVTCVIVLVLAVLPGMGHAFDHQHNIWDILLKKHVRMTDDGRVSKVNYSGMKKDAGLFKTYVSGLSAVTPDEYEAWTSDQKLAFLINAYNAFTVQLIVTHYPVDSIRDIGGLFQKPWDIAFIDLLGRKRTLDDIEHRMIRAKGVFDEPRIHVALVCAAVGCPALVNEAYTAEKLNSQLERALTGFLSHTPRNRFNASKKRFEISAIFKWYEQDFADSYGSLDAFLKRYGQTFAGDDPAVLELINRGDFTVDFLDYDWTLNAD